MKKVVQDLRLSVVVYDMNVAPVTSSSSSSTSSASSLSSMASSSSLTDRTDQQEAWVKRLSELTGGVHVGVLESAVRLTKTGVDLTMFWSYGRTCYYIDNQRSCHSWLSDFLLSFGSIIRFPHVLQSLSSCCAIMPGCTNVLSLMIR